MHKSKNKEHINHMRDTKKKNEMGGIKSNHISNYLNVSVSDSN